MIGSLRGLASRPPAMLWSPLRGWESDGLPPGRGLFWFGCGFVDFRPGIAEGGGPVEDQLLLG